MLARITLEVRGGLTHFPGHVPKPVSVTCTDSRDVDQLARFVDAARFFSRPDQGSDINPDAKTYLLRIAIGERSRALTFSDPINDKELVILLRFVRAVAGASKSDPASSADWD